MNKVGKMEKVFEKEKEFDIESIEVVKAQSVYDRASIYLFKSGEALKEGNTQNFINLIAWIESTLKVKLEKTDYDKNIQKFKKDMLGIDGNSPLTDNQRLALAFYKLEELNRFMDKKLPISIEGEI